MKRVLLASLFLALGLCACGVGTSGGSTTCGTYQGLDSSAQASTVTAMIKQHGGDTSAGNVELTLASTALYCTVHPSSAQISGIYQG